MDKLKMLFLSVFTRDRQHYIVLYVNRPSYAWRFEALFTVKEVVYENITSYWTFEN